jgi:enamine deaminase RidA (YjgF/YER057c/UK114 family)
LITISEKLFALGIELPPPPKPAGSYLPVVEVNDLIHISGQIPLDTNSDPPIVKYKGKIGLDTTIEKGQDAAILCTLNSLSLLKEYLGSLDKINKIVKLSAYINSVESFTDHPKVINPASIFLEKLFEEKGKHSRLAIGVSSLPLNSTIEIEFIIQVKHIIS